MSDWKAKEETIQRLLRELRECGVGVAIVRPEAIDAWARDNNRELDDAETTERLALTEDQLDSMVELAIEAAFELED